MPMWTLSAPGVDAARVSFPMLVFDGKERTKVKMNANKVKLSLAGKGVCFEIVNPKTAVLKRSGKELNHRNGKVEEVFAEVGKQAVYRITAE